MTIKRMKEELSESYIPKEFINRLPTECEECGTDLEINMLLREVSCGNLRCRGKLKVRMRSLRDDLKLSMTDEEIEESILYQNYSSPLQYFDYSYETYGELCEEMGEERSRELERELKKVRPQTIEEELSYAKLPYLEGSIKRLSAGEKSIEHLISNIQREGISYLMRKLGKEEELDTRLLRIYESIMSYHIFTF